MNPILYYGVNDYDGMKKLSKLLTTLGHPTTFDPYFEWYAYTRVLQFQIRCVLNEFSGWTIEDCDGIVGPQTWGTLERLTSTLTSPHTDSSDETEEDPQVDLQYTSPNYSARNSAITHIVLHNTACSFQVANDWLCNPAAKASAHLVLSRQGVTAQLVSFARKAWHAGNSRVNANSIGIELTASNSNKGLTPLMEGKLLAWLRYLMKEYSIEAENIILHRWVRSTDCPGFIWPTDNDFKAWRMNHFGG